MKKVFIGSSYQAREKATMIQEILEKFDVSVTHWTDEDAFILSESTIDSLIQAAHEHDAGVFILDKDDQIVKNNGDVQYVPRDNVIAEAGMFMGVLGRKAVVLCAVPGINIASDFKGITTLEYNLDNRSKLKNKLKEWLDLNVKEHNVAVGKNNVLMLPRHNIHDSYSIDSRLHISDRLYKKIRFIKIMNFASNIIINPNMAEIGHIQPYDSLAAAIEKIMSETKARVELILAEPNEYNLKDLKTKVANFRAGSSAGTLYSALETIYNNLTTDTIFSRQLINNLFQLYVMKTSMPFGIFNVEFFGEAQKFNHVKVDLYSAMLDNEDNRRSFVIWQADDPDNYKFFVENFDRIKNNSQLCESPSLQKIKKWKEKWQKMQTGVM